MEIILLINSHSYFVSIAFITCETSPRLVAFIEGEKLIDQRCKNIRGAQIALGRRLAKRKMEGAVFEWSQPYEPEQGWLQKLNLK
jgi:hypothetical protein